MSTAYPLLGGDVFMRHTDTDGRAYVHEHRVWNAALFVSTQQQEAQRLNDVAIERGKPAKAKAEQITDDQFRNERKAKP